MLAASTTAAHAVGPRFTTPRPETMNNQTPWPLVVLALLIGVVGLGLRVSYYNECRAHGFSVLYCVRSK